MSHEETRRFRPGHIRSSKPGEDKERLRRRPPSDEGAAMPRLFLLRETRRAQTCPRLTSRGAEFSIGVWRAGRRSQSLVGQVMRRS